MSIDERGFLSPDVDAYRTLLRDRWAEYFKHAEAVTKTCHYIKFKCAVHVENGQEVFAIGLFLKAVADVEGALLILERGMTSQAHSLLRVAIECEITLAKVCESPEFAQAYSIIAEQQRLMLIRGIHKTAPVHFKNLKAELSGKLVDDLVAKLKAFPVDKNLQQWAGDVGLGTIYNSSYRLYCEDVHSGASALASMYVTNSQQTITELNWGPDSKEDFRPALLEAARILLDVLQRSARLFQVALGEDFGKLLLAQKRLEDLVVKEGTK
jgi:hypothetical protein